jgi:hypothetical protein
VKDASFDASHCTKIQENKCKVLISASERIARKIETRSVLK